jgi:hypothetical protein
VTVTTPEPAVTVTGGCVMTVVTGNDEMIVENWVMLVDCITVVGIAVVDITVVAEPDTVVI